MQRVATAALVALSTVLLFWRLDGAPLWRDEGTTANWGRLMAESGVWVPRVFDGEQLIVQAADGHDFNSQFLPAMQSWLQFYVAGLSFKLFGVSEYSARLPFALLGVATLWALYRIGGILFGGGILSLAAPALAVTSIVFLTPVRQCRYYGLVIFASAFLIFEFVRYLRDPAVAASKGFYARLAAWGFLLYVSNYVSFAAMWGSLGIAALVLADRRFVRNLVLLSAGMALVMGIEFWLLHAEFAAGWTGTVPQSLAEQLRAALTYRGRDYWRGIPLVLLIPAAFWLYRRDGGRASIPAIAAIAVGVFAVVSPLVLGYGYREAGQWHPALFWASVAAFSLAPAMLAWCWKQLPEPGFWAKTAMFAALVIVVSPLIGIAAAKSLALTRYFYQFLPATAVLGALAVAAVHRSSGRPAAIGLFCALLIWPNLSSDLSGADGIGRNQLVRNDSYEGPFLEYLDENVALGEEIAFIRNVQGMMTYFYRPDLKWVCLLDHTVPHNQQFRGELPDAMFDDYPGADWYVIWDPRNEKAIGLTGEFEKVWEYSYAPWQSFWDRNYRAGQRTYQVYRRGSPAAGAESASAGSGG